MTSQPPNRSRFSQRIVALRKERGLTQVQFAKQIGITREMADYLENRANNPRAATIEKLARFFNVPVGYFFGEGEDNP